MMSAEKKNILFCAAEAAPFIKVGGLADVVGSLPAALHELGHDVRIILPLYGALQEKGIRGERVCGPIPVEALGQIHHISIYQTSLPPHHTPLYLVEWPGQFAGGAYDIKQTHDDIVEGVRRFVLWSWAVAHCLEYIPWKPDILHLHDWHAAAIPAFLQTLHRPCPPSVLTIHNLSIQGKWNAEELGSWIHIDTTTEPSLRMRDPHGDINMMQIGLYTCDLVSTVSPTYAKEILRPDFGEQLEHDLMTVGVTGIVNGVDTDVFNPETDTGIHQQFSVATVLEHKPKNTEVLRQQTQLPHQNGPLFGFIGRFTEQKGLDVLVQALPDIVALQGQVLVLGSGAADLEASMRSLQERYPDSIRVIERFDAVLAQQMYAGLDALLMPSRFEPCGLGQLIAMRYGTIPIVADTGGLHDTVVDVRTDAEHGTGYVVERTSSTSLVSAIEHFTEHRKNIQWLSALIQRSMKRDSSWYTSAHAYHQLYAEATKKHSAHRV